MTFHPFTMLCNHHQYFWNIFIALLPETPYSLSSHALHPHTQPLAAIKSVFCLWIWPFWIFHINGIIQYVAFCGWLFTQCNAFKVYWNRYTCFLLKGWVKKKNKGWVIFHCRIHCLLSIYSSVHGNLVVSIVWKDGNNLLIGNYHVSCCNEHLCTSFCLRPCLPLCWVHPHECHSWVIPC